MIIITALLLSMSFSATATNTPIEPLMVAIPAGTFLMGSERGDKNEQPVRQVQISPFMLGKYEITIAEFKQFVAATNYDMSQTCIHEADQNWFLRPISSSQNDLQDRNNWKLAVTAGSWDKNSISDNEFEPVVCIGWDAAQAYTAWLKEETGKPYRLPTEAEWEYAHRAGSRSTYSFGELDDIEKACLSGNIADKYAEEVAGKLFKAGYGGKPVACNDKSGLVSIVGLYQPNAFGVFDMLGNVEEWVQDCYADDYSQAPINGKSVEIDNCKQRVLRGGSWHYLTYSASQRAGREGGNFIGVLEGFRLALDGDKSLVSASSKKFEKRLNKEQQQQQQKMALQLDFPKKPTGLQVTKNSKNKITLSWDNPNDSATTSYDIYRSISYFDESHKLASNIKGQEFVDLKPLIGRVHYRIVAVNTQRKGDFSEMKSIGQSKVHSLPGKIQGEAFQAAPNAVIAASISEPKEDRGYLGFSDSEALYQVVSTVSASYQVTFRVFNNGENQPFELWQGDNLLAILTPTGKRGWQTITEPKIYLSKGAHLLNIKANHNNFALNWLQFEKL